MNEQIYINKVYEAKRYSFEYYVLAKPTVSDSVFDALVDEIEKIESKHPEWIVPFSPTQCVGSDLFINGTVRHHTPMLSCQKAQDFVKVDKWCRRILNKEKIAFMIGWKLDGISCSLIYNRGKLVSASTRGNGKVGRNILHHVKCISSVPKNISYPSRVEIRGEIVCLKSSLSSCVNNNGECFSDCRTAASSICSTACATENSSRLSFYAFEVFAEGWSDSMFSRLIQMKTYGFHSCLDFSPCASVVSSENVFSLLNEFEERRKTLDFPTDGLVIRLDSIQRFIDAGFTNHHPKGSIAYKFAPVKTTAKVESINISIGKTGKRTPVISIFPVVVAGKTIRRISVGSERVLDHLGIEVGDVVVVGLSNDVIPKIYGVVN